MGVEENDERRIPYLSKLLAQRQELDYLGQEVEKTMVDDQIFNYLYLIGQ